MEEIWKFVKEMKLLKIVGAVIPLVQKKGNVVNALHITERGMSCLAVCFPLMLRGHITEALNIFVR